MAACIRAPRGQAASMETMNHSKVPSTAAHHKSIIQIYTDWGNHYLEKARSKKLLTDLQTDLVDGVLLADLIEAVTNHKVPDVHRKPKTAALMVENIRACLVALERLGVNLEGISVKELREGSLKSVLALFFALSKYKQHLKLQAEANKAKKHDDMLSRLPTPYQSPIGHGHATSIPTPLSLRHNQSVHPVSSSPLKCPSASSSRSTSPSHSFIPTPRSQGRSVAPEKQSVQRISAVRTPQTPASSPYSTPVKNNSMLDKLKLFNQKDKQKQVSGSAKRTSSSSGFSSARSERSDSSTSLHSDAKSSTTEKKESSQNDLNKSHLRKKIVKADSKIVRPGRSTGSNGRLPQQSSLSAPVASSQPGPFQATGETLTYPGSINRGTLRHLEPASTGQGQGQRREHKVEEGSRSSPASRRRDSPQQELAQPANPPPPPAPSSNTPMDGVEYASEPLRVAGGAGGIPKPSSTACVGIPKPTAVVKGYIKPTHPVAPLPPAPHPPEPLYAALEKEKSALDPRHPLDQRNHNQLFKPEKLEVVLEKSHERQTSLEESEDGANVKPMQPLLPGYNNRGIAIHPRTIPLNRSRGGAYKPLDTYPRSNTERNFAECDYGSPNVTSGYMSDGEVLHSKACDIQDGYLSEGGTTLYRRADARLGLDVNTGEACAVKLGARVDMKGPAWSNLSTQQKEVAWLKKEDDNRIIGEFKSYILLDAVKRKEQKRYFAGLPVVYECGFFRDTVFITMELLGPDLLDLFIVCDYRFSLKTVIQIVVQLLRTLKYVHGCGILHRDIKPDNCMIGKKCNRTENTIYLVDFGNSREFIDRRRNAHIRPKIGQSLHGNARFASLNVHLGKECSRRDDLESLSYMMVYFLKGSLPWQGLDASEITDLWSMVAETKRITPLSILCDGLPQEFLNFARYIRKLKFFDTPDYDYWIKQFMGLYQSMKYSDINEFDWTKVIESESESD